MAGSPIIARERAGVFSSPLCFFHTHTNETLEVACTSKGIAANQQHAVNHFLRDFRTEEVTSIDDSLLLQLAELKHRVGNQGGVYEIISAYRSPKTNNMLRGKSKGVAKKSFHLQGRAIDMRLRGTATSDLRDTAIAMQGGGVGYYKCSDFIHLDTGRVRAWRG
jgi:uncharacterized protein YcbK (DUF882 family)